MFAVIETSGQQIKVEKGQKIVVDHINHPEGSTITLDKVLLISSGTDLKIGMPWLTEATVEGKIVSHQRGEKIRVFKMKPKRRYQRTKGHRSGLTTLEITDIKEITTVGKKEESKKKEPEKSITQKTSAKKITKKAPAKQESLL